MTTELTPEFQAALREWLSENLRVQVDIDRGSYGADPSIIIGLRFGDEVDSFYEVRETLPPPERFGRD